MTRLEGIGVTIISSIVASMLFVSGDTVIAAVAGVGCLLIVVGGKR